MTEQPKTRIIALTEQTPVIIQEDEWPVIASSDYLDYDNESESQANRVWKISFYVRQHADGRALVYAVYDYSTHLQGEKSKIYKAGRLSDDSSDLPGLIFRVTYQLLSRISDNNMRPHIRDLMHECVENLPAQKI